MKQFGYQLMQCTTLSLAEQDKALYQRLVADAPEFRACLSCGACAAACPINARRGGRLSVRRTLVELSRGINPSAGIEQCQMCNRCSLVCPRGLNTRAAFFLLARYRAEQQ